jgi:crotonobetainyl-CoA:carnitine CoA-transferase CaiB-like acyl-CoA transferase
MGANVIKIEPPEGEPWRLIAQFVPKESRWYVSLNRNKRSLVLDLNRPETREVLERLAPSMDVAIVNYRPDVAEKLGIDYPSLRALNPRLIYCDNTAYGRKGPEAHRGGYDIVVQGMTGLMALDGKSKDGVPQVPTLPAADFMAGTMMAWAICAALFHRQRTGQGQKIETSLLGSALAAQTGWFLSVHAVDLEWQREFVEKLHDTLGNGPDYEEIHELWLARRPVTRVGNIYYRVFRTKDSFVVVGCLADPLRKKLCDVLGLHDIRFEPGWDPGSQEAQEFGQRLVAQAEEIFRQRTTEDWVRIFDERGVPSGPLRFVEELLEDPQVLANDLVMEVEHSLVGTVRTVGPPVKMGESPLRVQRASPALGEHTDDVLTEFGYAPDQIADLRARGVVS